MLRYLVTTCKKYSEVREENGERVCVCVCVCVCACGLGVALFLLHLKRHWSVTIIFACHIWRKDTSEQLHLIMSYGSLTNLIHS